MSKSLFIVINGLIQYIFSVIKFMHAAGKYSDHPQIFFAEGDLDALEEIVMSEHNYD